MINPNHLKTEVIKPVLSYLDMYSEAAVNLVLGTAIQESNCGSYLKQLEGGPALGIYQCEPETHRSIWCDYLFFNKTLGYLIEDYISSAVALWDNDDSENKVEEFINESFYELPGNLYYATAICRAHYGRFKEPLPHEDDIVELGKYWKKYYNTISGKGTVDEFVNNYRRVIG